MSIFTSEVKECGVVVMPDNSVVITYSKTTGGSGFDGLRITTPRQAHDIREAVNKAVDILLRNDLKKGI